MGKAFGSWEPMPEEKQSMLLMLHQGEIEEASLGVCQIVKDYGLLVSPEKLERLLQAWIHNTFDYSEDPHGYATYFFPSFMSHSCLPNAFWHYGDRDIYVL